jgi:hypothetical protein
MKISMNEIRKLVLEALNEEIAGLDALDDSSNSDPLAGIDPASGRVVPVSGRAAPGRSVQDGPATGAPAGGQSSSAGGETYLGAGDARGEQAQRRREAIRRGWYAPDGRTITDAGRREVTRRAAAFLNQFRAGQNPDPSGLLAGGQGRAYDLEHMAYRTAARRWNLEQQGLARRQAAQSRPSGQAMAAVDPTLVPGFQGPTDSWLGRLASQGAARAPMAPATGARPLTGVQSYQMNENILRKLIRKIVQEQMNVGNLPPRAPGSSRLPPVPTEPPRQRAPQQPRDDRDIPPVPDTEQPASLEEKALTEMIRKIVRQTYLNR